MFIVKDLQVNAPYPNRTAFCPYIARSIPVGANGELTSAMQYFCTGFSCHPFPDKYDMLMDIATEELTHLQEIVRTTLQMLLQSGKRSKMKGCC